MPRDFNIPKGVVDVCRYRGRKLAQLQIFYPSALRCCGVIGRFAHGKTMASKVGRAARWGLLASLKRRFGIQQAIFVFDSGMSSTLNLEAMREEHLHFVTRLSAATLREVIAQLPHDMQPQLWDRTQLIELTLEDKPYVIAGGEHRQQRDSARRRARLEKAQIELQRLAAVRRKKPNPQKLASQAGRALQRLKAHKYFRYWVDEQGQLQYQKNDELIQTEQSLDSLYLLHTNLEPAQYAKEQVLGNYKNLLAEERHPGPHH